MHNLTFSEVRLATRVCTASALCQTPPRTFHVGRLSHAAHVAHPCAGRLTEVTYRELILYPTTSPVVLSSLYPVTTLLTMDRVQVAQDTGKLSEAASGGATLAQYKPSSPTVSSRQSQTTPLVPLEFLQNQRRGSITDPSLHAAGPSAHPHAANMSTNNSKSPPSSRNTEASAALGQCSPASSDAFSRK